MTDPADLPCRVHAILSRACDQRGVFEVVKGLLIWLHEKEFRLIAPRVNAFQTRFLYQKALSLDAVSPSEPWRLRWYKEEVNVDLHFNFPECHARVRQDPTGCRASQPMGDQQ